MRPLPVLNYSTPEALDAVPVQRAYRHLACGTPTVVSGKEFVRLADPYITVTATLVCANCQRTDTLASFEWVDTGEDLLAYRNRVRNKAPAILKIWSGVQAVVLIFFDVLGVAIGAATGGGLTETPTGSVIGALVGMVLAVALGPLVLWPINRLLRVDFRRYR